MESIEDIIRRVVREEIRSALADMPSQATPAAAPPASKTNTFAKRFLTTREAAEEVNRHPVTITKALEAGVLHGTQSKKGGRWTVKIDCLEAWVERLPCPHRVKPPIPIKSSSKR